MKRKTLFLSLICCVIFLFAAIKTVDVKYYIDSDFFTFWIAGRMLLNGEQPYSNSQWVAEHEKYGANWIGSATYLYPLPTAIFYTPLSLLPPYYAYILWVWISLILLSLSFLFLFFSEEIPGWKHYIFPVVAGIILFRPTILTLRNGQFSSLLLLLLAAGICLWEKKRWLSGSMVLALLMLKPTIGAPILAFISAWLIMKKQYSPLVGFALTGKALWLIGLAVDPHWVSEYLGAGTNKLLQTFGFSPTIWGLAAYASNFDSTYTLIAGSLAGLLLSGLCLYILWRTRQVLRPAWAFSVIIPTALLITPYIWPYDQLLLIIPILIVLIEMIRRKAPFLLTATAFIWLDLAALLIFLASLGIQLEAWSSMIPLVVLGSVTALAWQVNNAASGKPAPLADS